MTRSIIAISALFLAACGNGGDETVLSTSTDPTAELDVDFPEVDTALPDFDSDTDTDTDSDSDSDPDSDSATTLPA